MLHDSMTRMGEVLRNAREAKGLTQAALAEMIGASTRTIIAIEKNKRNPTCDVLYRLIRILDISADSLFRPDKTTLTPEQEQFFNEFLSCNQREQQVVLQTMRCLMRSLHKTDKMQDE